MQPTNNVSSPCILTAENNPFLVAGIVFAVVAGSGLLYTKFCNPTLIPPAACYAAGGASVVLFVIHYLSPRDEWEELFEYLLKSPERFALSVVERGETHGVCLEPLAQCLEIYNQENGTELHEEDPDLKEKMMSFFPTYIKRMLGDCLDQPITLGSNLTEEIIIIPPAPGHLSKEERIDFMWNQILRALKAHKNSIT